MSGTSLRLTSIPLPDVDFDSVDFDFSDVPDLISESPAESSSNALGLFNLSSADAVNNHYAELMLLDDEEDMYFGRGEDRMVGSSSSMLDFQVDADDFDLHQLELSQRRPSAALSSDYDEITTPPLLFRRQSISSLTSDEETTPSARSSQASSSSNNASYLYITRRQDPLRNPQRPATSSPAKRKRYAHSPLPHIQGTSASSRSQHSAFRFPDFDQVEQQEISNKHSQGGDRHHHEGRGRPVERRLILGSKGNALGIDLRGAMDTTPKVKTLSSRLFV